MAAGYLSQSAPAPTSSLADGALGSILSAVEIVGPGALMAYLNARNPAEGKTYHESFGYPTDVALGGALGLVGFIMLMSGSKSGSHVLRLGLGCLAEAGIRMGFEKGVADRNESKALPGKQKLQLVEGRNTSTEIQKSTSQDVFQKVR